MRIFLRVMAVAAALVPMCQARFAEAQIVWNDPGGTDDWSEPLWSSDGMAVSPPNAVGVEVRFNGLATADNPNQTSNRTVRLDADYTVGRIVFNNDGEFATSTASTNRVAQIRQFESSPDVFVGSLTFDATSGDATIFVPQVPFSTLDPSRRIHSLATITAPMVLTDNLVVTNDNTGSFTFFGTLHLQGPMTGPGGFTKLGEGRTNFEHTTPGANPGQNDSPKTYTGPTIISAGSFSLSPISSPAQSSSFTIDGSAGLDLAYDGVYTLGASDLILNSDGTGASANGTIRPRRTATSGNVVTITNDIVLQSTAIIHSQTQNDVNLGSITLSGDISGGAGAQLQLTAPNSNNQTGTYILQGDNSYAGGTLLRGGQLIVSNGLGTGLASLGTGDVTVENNMVAPFFTTRSKLLIETGILDAIDDAATLSLAGGGAAGADTGFAELTAGINETVAGLILGGTPQTVAGTYGSTSSGAMFPNDEFFSGSGVVTLAPAVVNDADFDDDGDVDGSDFLVWQRGVGVGTDNATGDANGSGTVDSADLDVWKGAFGTGGAVAAVGAVPEPATVLLAVLAVPLALLARRKR